MQKFKQSGARSNNVDPSEGRLIMIEYWHAGKAAAYGLFGGTAVFLASELYSLIEGAPAREPGDDVSLFVLITSLCIGVAVSTTRWRNRKIAAPLSRSNTSSDGA